MVQVLPQHENEGWNKRVESVWFPCADEGSTPSSSTKTIKNHLESHIKCAVLGDFLVSSIRMDNDTDG